MKRLFLLAIAGTMALSSSAQTTPENSVTVRGYQIDLPTKEYRMFKGDFENYQGSYDLSNGDVMTLRQIGMHMYARVGDGEPKEIIAAARGVFVAKDRELKLTLDRQDADNIRGELLMVVPRASWQQAKAGAGQVIRLSAR